MEFNPCPEAPTILMDMRGMALKPTYLPRNVHQLFIQRAMPMPRSTVMTWTGFMLISNIVR